MQITTGNHYLAFVLDEATKARLQELFPPVYPDFKCHHVTLAYDISEANIATLQELVDNFAAGKLYFHADHYYRWPDMEYFYVLVNGEWMKTDQSITHLTYSKNPDVPSKKASAYIKTKENLHMQYVVYTDIITLEGRMELIPKSV